ncbi:ABC transporter substrate-binding protein [Streptomyces rugosispiralis]|uniref:ABC transporter substrate-binding protein n=1 Tax=Streptomyces rugosispiralis TaxID=2967341 RepID=A0ABT1UP54_9ACTN|nr:ABC transporter substrate-binding protein [Streptomyces rugosispiralis]MCQ8186912.1 ABC transporter substrate-binding protein [Streptomyces rugosispiralis]
MMSISQVRRRSRRLPVVAVTAAVAALALNACSSPSVGSNAVSDEITIADHAIPQSLDPMSSASYETTQLTFLWGGYLTNYADGKDSGSPQLARSVTASPDGLTWTVKLRSGLKFSDGSALTSKDVVASLDRILSTPNVAGDNFIGPVMSSIKKVTAPDGHTVSLAMSRPYPGLPAALSTPEMVILPASGIAKGDSFWKHPVSAGRFKLDTLDTTNGKFTLSANPNYYDTAPRRIKKINFVAVTDAATRLAQLKSGQVDYADNIPGNLLSQVKSPLTLDTAKWNGGQMGLSVNFNDPVAGDKRVRQAISLAVNRQQIAASALGGERVGRPLYGIPWNQDNDSPNAKATKRDIGAAKAKLKGTKCENGCTIPLVTVTDSAWQVPLVAQVVQQQLKAIGIRLEIENTPFTQVGDRLKQGDWGLFTRWIGYYENTRTYLGGYIYGDPTSGNNANFWGTLPTTPDMPGLKALSDRLKTASSSAAPGLVEKINEEYAKELPSIPLTTLSYVGVSRFPGNVIHSVGASYLVLP